MAFRISGEIHFSMHSVETMGETSDPYSRPYPQIYSKELEDLNTKKKKKNLNYASSERKTMGEFKKYS